MAGYPEAELEAVRIVASNPPELTLVYRVLNGPQAGARIRLGTLVSSVHYLDLPDEPLEEGEYGDRSKEDSHYEEEASQEGGDHHEEEDGQHCECYECEDCPHEEAIYCQACASEEDVDEEFWDE
jgi:hypothetical protein